MEFSNYRLTKELGRGGMAIVYLAQDNKFDTMVAIKVLNKEFVHNENIRKRFIAEARKMFKMSHPNIIKVTDLIEEGDTVAFVMEYVEGETLKDFIDRKGKLSEDEIKYLFSQMLEAVGYVHKQQLVHRDIKPSNFMINQEGQIKLMDFGIAKTTDTSSAEYTQTATGVQMGTPMYMSPEQITETRNVTAQSDIYSLGVVLWQMVMGQKPYDIKTLSNFQLQIKIVNEPLEYTNTNWDDLIQKATTKEIASRILSATAFKIILESKNDIKVIESDSTIIDNVIKQASKPNPSSELEERLNNEKKQVKEEVQLQAPKKNYLPVIIIVALCLTILVFYFFYNLGSSSNYEDAEKVKADSILTESSGKESTDADKKTINDTSLNINQSELITNNEISSLFTQIGVFTDSRNGYTYSVVQIGKQVWMGENLDVETFRNGDAIPQIQNKDDFRKAGEKKQPAWCYYEGSSKNGAKYGRLYNWYAVNDPRGLAPVGWHIPSNNEISILSKYLGGNNKAGKKMKSKEGWLNDGNGSNESGFNALPGSSHNSWGWVQGSLGTSGFWWTSTLDHYYESFGRTEASVHFFSLYDGEKNLNRNTSSGISGNSVRCIRD
jgi:uncharacterized protein (TIGR02145 family)